MLLRFSVLVRHEKPFRCIRLFMKRNRNIRKAIRTAFDLPDDLDPSVVQIHWIGDTVLIEQHRGILGFDPGEVRFLCEQGSLTVTGEQLRIMELSESRAYICGTITGIFGKVES